MIIPLRKFLPGIAWFFIILAVMCIPGGNLPKDDWFSRLYVDKWIHAGIFALLTILFCRPFMRSQIDGRIRLHYFIRIALSAALYGIITELIQKNFIAGRSFDVWDVVFDAIGSVIGFIYSYKRFLNK